MDVFRKEPLPAIYTELGFVRKFAPYGILADCPKDLSLLRKLQSVVAGDACISSLERDHTLFVKAEFPDDIQARGGSSDDVIEWRVFCWKLWDAESLVTRRPNPLKLLVMKTQESMLITSTRSHIPHLVYPCFAKHKTCSSRTTVGIKDTS